jgi:hypothetical protein
MAHIHEAGVETWHNIPDPTKIDVSYRVATVALLLVQFYKDLVLKYCDINFSVLGVDY